MAQSVECLTPDFSSGHDLRVMRSSPVLGSVLGVEIPQDSLPLPLPFPCSHTCVRARLLSLSLSQKKEKLYNSTW